MKHDLELALLDMGKALRTLVSAYKPNANHMSVDCIDGNIHVRACEYDGEKYEYVEKDILNATLFKDGTLYIDGQYIRPDEVA